MWCICNQLAPTATYNFQKIMILCAVDKNITYPSGSYNLFIIIRSQLLAGGSQIKSFIQQILSEGILWVRTCTTSWDLIVNQIDTISMPTILQCRIGIKSTAMHVIQFRKPRPHSFNIDLNFAFLLSLPSLPPLPALSSLPLPPSPSQIRKIFLFDDYDLNRKDVKHA